jgi:hypothetical protein
MKQNMHDECYTCRHARKVSGDCHIACANPDPEMTGNPHGITKGWFHYPVLFDPVWKTKDCNNYDRKLSVMEPRNE